MKTKILTIIIVLVLTIMLTGCGQQPTTQQQPQIPAKQVIAPTEPQQPSQPVQETKAPETQTPKTYNIEISGFAFNPSTLTIKTGDTIVWTNQDSAPHTITSDSGNEISSSNIQKGGTYSHTFTTAGTYAYHCAIHTSMKATVVVE